MAYVLLELGFKFCILDIHVYDFQLHINCITNQLLIFKFLIIQPNFLSNLIFKLYINLELIKESEVGSNAFVFTRVQNKKKN